MPNRSAYVRWILVILIVLVACDTKDDRESPRLREFTAYVCNQVSGTVTVINLKTDSIIEIVDLSERLQEFKDQGGSVDDSFILNPRPHYVQPSSDGRYLYIVNTNQTGAVMRLNGNLNVVAFREISNTTFPAHMQLTSDDQTIYLSCWTTNLMGQNGGVSTSGNMIIRLSADLASRANYITPAGAHGIKLTPDEKTVLVGHDLADFINVVDVNRFDRLDPLSTAIPLTIDADTTGGQTTSRKSPSQLAVSPDGKYSFFACRVSSELMVYDIPADTIAGYLDLNTIYSVTKAGPYSVEVGPKIRYSESASKTVYINLKDGGAFARLHIDMSKSAFVERFTAGSGDIIHLEGNDARPHGLDITDDGKIAVVSSEFKNSNATAAQTFIIELQTFAIRTTLNTKHQSRGVAIYPGSGN